MDKNKLLECFIKEPERKFYVRELARLLNKSPTTISKYLKNYEKKKILISERKFNHLLFKANNESKEFKQMKLSFNLNLIRDSGVVDFLVKEFNNPETIVVFGSFAKAENSTSSDIDVLIISSVKKEVNLRNFERKLRYKIQLFVHSNKEIEEIKKKNKELLNSWVNGIVLYGFFEVFK